MNVSLTHVRMMPHVLTKLMDTHANCDNGYTGTDCKTGNYVIFLLTL